MSSRKETRIAGLVLVFAVLTVCFLPHTSCTSNKTPGFTGSLENRNVIVIVIDALRYDHLGCYGYKRGTSPFINSLAEKSIVFDRAYSNSSFTRESVAALLTGLLPSRNGCTGWSSNPPESVKKMGQLFHEAGYRTGFFSNSSVIKSPQFSQGFEKVWYSEKWGISGNGPVLSRRAGDFVKECAKTGGKFMIYLHYLDPHGPYHPPRGHYLKITGKKRKDNPAMPKVVKGKVSLYKQVRKNLTHMTSNGFGPGEARFEDMVTRYDAEISLVDESIKQLYRTLEENHLLDNTVVLITSDHGEEFLEHGFVEHAWTLYDESIRVPLILSAPGKTRPGRIADPVSIVDILPTLLKLGKIPTDRTDFDGSALFTVNKNGQANFIPPAKPVVSELLIQHRNLVRVVIKDNWKYMSAIKWLTPAERSKALINAKEFERDRSRHLDTWGPPVREELYDMSTDPGELTNLVTVNKEKRMMFRKLMKGYELYCRKMGIKSKNRNEAGKLSDKDREKLKSLGYL